MPRRRPRDRDEPLEAHHALEAERLMGEERGEVEARAPARRPAGKVTKARERLYEVGRPLFWDALAQDVCFGVRMLRKSPLFTALAVITLALGIGANAALFSLLYDALLAPLPIPRPQELVQLTKWQDAAQPWPTFNWPYFAPLLEPTPLLPGLFACLDREMTLRSESASERVRALGVSGSYFNNLGIRAIVGRTLTAADDQPGAAPAVVLSYSYWRRRFGLDPRVLGAIVYLDGTGFSIVGVTPPGFHGLNRLSPADVTFSLRAVPLPQGTSHYVRFFTRLGPAQPIVHARAQVAARFRALLDGDSRMSQDWMRRLQLDVVSAAAGDDLVRARLRQPLSLVAASFLLVLVICCANLATLLLARGHARSRELGVRLALGAGRGRVIRQRLTESVLLSALGSGLGLAVGFWIHRLLVALLAVDPAGALAFRLHWPLLLFTAVLSMLTGIAFGLVPALNASRWDPCAVMRGDAQAAGGGRPRATRALLVVQAAAAVVFLFTGALFVRTLRNLESVDAGFDRDRLVLMAIDARESRFRGARLASLLDQLGARLSAVPGVESVTFAQSVLFGRSPAKTVWLQSGGGRGTAVYNMVGPGFFKTARIPLLIGRGFSNHDRFGGPPVAVVNQAFVRRYLEGRNPLGRRFGDQGPTSAGRYEIVGVVKDARHSSLRHSPFPAVFQSLRQCPPDPPFVLHARITDSTAETVAAIRREIETTDPTLAVYDVRTMADQVNETLRQERMFAAISALLGALVLGLCSVGLYGVSADSVTRRTNEIGLRMALGARPADVLRLMLAETLWLVIAGVAVGVPVAVACARFIRSRLFGLTPLDPAAIVVAIALLAGVAAAACFVPARRATKIDPMAALKYE